MIALWLVKHREGAVGAVLALVLLGVIFHRHSGPALPAAIVQRIDSVWATHAPDSIARANAEREQARQAALARAATQRARTDSIAAAKLRLEADSLAALALHTHDTTDVWRDAYTARDAEARALRSQVTNLADANARLAADTVSLRGELDSAVRRMQATERLNRDIAAAAARAGECYIVPFVRCPSRTVAAIGGAALLEAGRFALTGRP